MSCEREGVVIKLVQGEQEWRNTLLRQTGIDSKDIPKVLGVWTQIADADWQLRCEQPDILINETGLQKYRFPEGSIECKIAHEMAEWRLFQAGNQKKQAHLAAVEAELRKADELGILEPYFKAEVLSSLKTGLIIDAAQKTLAYLRLKATFKKRKEASS